MLLNISRLKSYMACPRQAFNRYQRMLEGPRSLNLVDGSALHKGIAVGQATKDWSNAQAEAAAQFDTDFEAAGMLAEEDYLIESHKRIIAAMIECYRENYEHQDIQVVQPECEFCVAIPGTEHNDITVHHIECAPPDQTGQWYTEKWGMPSPQAILEGRIRSPHTTPAEDCQCWQPHRLQGKTDGIIQWNGFLWLQEHKTTSISGDQFWQQWHIDMQLTAYIYGVSKALGIQPKGVILNAINKPSEGQVANWNSRRKHGPPKPLEEYISYSREVFLRTDHDLAAFEQQFKDYCDEWEHRILSGVWPMANIPSHCFSYNRKCDYYNACLEHNSDESLALLNQRAPDYVDQKRQELVQIYA